MSIDEASKGGRDLVDENAFFYWITSMDREPNGQIESKDSLIFRHSQCGRKAISILNQIKWIYSMYELIPRARPKHLLDEIEERIVKIMNERFMSYIRDTELPERIARDARLIRILSSGPFGYNDKGLMKG